VCLCADRPARAYAYRVLILEELERFGVTIRFLEGRRWAPTRGPRSWSRRRAIAEFERAKSAERSRRGKLYRARAGEIFLWTMSYGFRRVVPDDGAPARMEIFEPEAQVVREIIGVYDEGERSMRQIAHDLHDSGVPSPTASRSGVSKIGRPLRNEAYIGTPTTSAAKRSTATAPAARARARRATPSAPARSGSRSRCPRSSTRPPSAKRVSRDTVK
jgi:site-specific DNA recombinase